jgi:hypothetical protein
MLIGWQESWAANDAVVTGIVFVMHIDVSVLLLLLLLQV